MCVASLDHTIQKNPSMCCSQAVKKSSTEGGNVAESVMNQNKTK